MKSASTKRFKAFKKVSHKIERVIGLTGTPASNNLLDLYGQVFLLDQGKRLGKTLTKFKDQYFQSDYRGYHWTLKKGAKTEIYKRLGDICLSLSKKDYTKLPEKIDNIIEIPLLKKQIQQY